MKQLREAEFLRTTCYKNIIIAVNVRFVVSKINLIKLLHADTQFIQYVIYINYNYNCDQPRFLQRVVR